MGVLNLNAADGFAIAMLGVICLSWSLVLLLFWSMRRQAAKRDPDVDALLEEISKRERDASGLRPLRRKAWEKDPDWWKHRRN